MSKITSIVDQNLSAKKRYKALIRVAWAVLIVGLLVTISAPWVLTQKYGLISFADTGEIGDTIGGITSPIVGFIGAILVFIAFIAQIEANQTIIAQFNLQKKEDDLNRNFSNLLLLLTRLEAEINSFQIQETKKDYPGMPKRGDTNYKIYTESLTGSSAIKFVLLSYLQREKLDENELIRDPKASEILFTMDFFINIIAKIKKTSLAHDDKSLILLVLSHLYKSKIGIVFDSFTSGIDEEVISENTSENLFFQKRNKIDILLYTLKSEIKLD